MKNLIITLSIFAAVLAGILSINIIMSKKTDELLILCEQLTEKSETNNQESIKALYDDINSKWQSLRKILFFVLNHTDIDSVDLALTELSYAIKQNDIPCITEYAEKLKFYIDELLDTEEVSWENIL